MRRLTAVCILWFGMFSGTPAAGQIVAPAPPGPYVIDVRGLTSAIPQDAGFFPSVPAGTSVPSRGSGIEVGAHVYLMRFGPARLGIGASALRVRRVASPAPHVGSLAVRSGALSRAQFATFTSSYINAPCSS